MNKYYSFFVLAIFISTLTITQTLQAQALRTGTRVIEALTSQANISRFLSQNGLEQTQESINLSWRALTNSNGAPTTSELQSALRSLNLDEPRDQQIRQNLQKVLMKNTDDVSSEDLSSAINGLIYLANRHGQSQSLTMACSTCMTSSLANRGVQYTLQTATDPNVRHILENILPSNPQGLRNYIARRMRKMGIGDYSRVTLNQVSPQEERNLGVFLAMADHGSAKQKELVKAVLQFSKTQNGETLLINPKNPHQFWSLFTEQMSDESLERWSVMLRQIASQTSDEAKREEAFYGHLARQVGSDSTGQEYVKRLRAQRCFFK